MNSNHHFHMTDHLKQQVYTNVQQLPCIVHLWLHALLPLQNTHRHSQCSWDRCILLDTYMYHSHRIRCCSKWFCCDRLRILQVLIQRIWKKYTLIFVFSGYTVCTFCLNYKLTDFTVSTSESKLTIAIPIRATTIVQTLSFTFGQKM